MFWGSRNLSKVIWDLTNQFYSKKMKLKKMNFQAIFELFGTILKSLWYNNIAKRENFFKSDHVLQRSLRMSPANHCAEL